MKPLTVALLALTTLLFVGCAGLADSNGVSVEKTNLVCTGIVIADRGTVNITQANCTQTSCAKYTLPSLLNQEKSSVALYSDAKLIGATSWNGGMATFSIDGGCQPKGNIIRISAWDADGLRVAGTNLRVS